MPAPQMANAIESSVGMKDGPANSFAIVVGSRCAATPATSARTIKNRPLIVSANLAVIYPPLLHMAWAQKRSELRPRRLAGQLFFLDKAGFFRNLLVDTIFFLDFLLELGSRHEHADLE